MLTLGQLNESLLAGQAHIFYYWRHFFCTCSHSVAYFGSAVPPDTCIMGRGGEGSRQQICCQFFFCKSIYMYYM